MNKPIQETIVLSVGGSMVVPNGGVDYKFLNKFNSFIRKHVKKGRRFFIVVGGGTTARHYRDAGAKVIGEIRKEDLDWIGIHATRLNAHLLRTIFEDIAHPRIIENYERKLSNWKEPVVIGSGWKPGWSTDYDAVILARDYNAPLIINLSDIDCVYDKDPKKFKNAKRIEKTTWTEFLKIVGVEWSPGINAPFDPVASRLAQELKLTVIITNGSNFKNLDNILNGQEFKGTTITPAKIDASYYDKDYRQGLRAKEGILSTLKNLYRAFWIKLILNPKNCLDVGCGRGKLVYFLRKLGVEAFGIEISQKALEEADKEMQPYLRQGVVTNIPFPDSYFDVVVSYGLLEHLERAKLRSAVDETVRVSRKWILHKVFTTENSVRKLTDKKDISHLSILSKQYWLNMFKYIEEVQVVRKFYLKLPAIWETLFLLRKKTI